MSDAPSLPLNVEYMLYDTMCEWHMSPEVFEKLHPNHQSMMMAFILSKRLREAYITDWYEQKSKNK